MYAQNVKASEQVGILGAINPSSQAAGAANTGWISIADFQKLLAIVQVGTFGAAATVDAKIQQATDNAGTGAKDVAGAAIAQMAAGGGNNKQAEIDLDAAQLDVEGGFDFVQLELTVGAAATETAALLIGFNPRFAPPANAASVAQVVG